MNIFVSNVTKDDSPAARIALRMRLKMYRILESLVDMEQLDSVLDIGVTADRSRPDSNFFEEVFPWKERITAISNQNAAWMEQKYPGLHFVFGDGCRLPFRDRSFDLVFSSAVIEHVGHVSKQEKFLAEAIRVSRRYVFFTTPNRWHPIEFHTALPLLHWLPPELYRTILSGTKYRSFADENVLNLLSRKKLDVICHNLGIEDFRIYSVSFLLFPSNLILFIQNKRERL